MTNGNGGPQTPASAVPVPGAEARRRADRWLSAQARGLAAVVSVAQVALGLARSAR